MSTTGDNTRVVFVSLLDEGTDVRRPTRAVSLGGLRFRLLPTDDYDPEEERREFPPDSVVECRPRPSEGGEILVAFRRPD